MNRVVIRAETSFPNTPESDAMPKVWHDVHVMVDGRRRIVRLLSAAPDSAIAELREMEDGEFERLLSGAQGH